MTDSSLQDNLSLFQMNKQLLAESKITNQLLLQQCQQQDEIKTELQKLTYLLNAYTSGGTPQRSYVPDHMLVAYLSIVGPALGNRISREENDPAEILKAAIIIARDLLSELNDYNNSPAAGQQAIENALRTARDPWQEPDESDTSDDQ